MKKSLLLLLGVGSLLLVIGMLLVIVPASSVEAMQSPDTTIDEDCGDEAAEVVLAHAGSSTAGLSLLLQATATPDPDDDMNEDTTTGDMADMAADSPGFCLDCHSDAERLQLLAEVEEVAESLNEGSG